MAIGLPLWVTDGGPLFHVKGIDMSPLQSAVPPYNWETSYRAAIYAADIGRSVW